jgi:hypothetical protein
LIVLALCLLGTVIYYEESSILHSRISHEVLNSVFPYDNSLFVKVKDIIFTCFYRLRAGKKTQEMLLSSKIQNGGENVFFNLKFPKDKSSKQFFAVFFLLEIQLL